MRCKSLRSVAWIMAAVMMVFFAGCGGGTNTSYGYGPIQVTGMVPGTVCGPLPELVTITGLDFSTIIGDGTEGGVVPELLVTFTAVSPHTPFYGGTESRVEMRGQITGLGELEVMTPAAVICGVAEIAAYVRVTLPSGVQADSATPIAVFAAPTIAGGLAIPGGGSTFPAATPTAYSMTVDGGGPGSCAGLGALFDGMSVVVHWERDAAPFIFGGPVDGSPVNPQVGTANHIETLATFTGPSTLEGLSPVAVVCSPGVSEYTANIVRIEFPDGSCTPPSLAIATGFRAPTLTAIVNTGAESLAGTNTFPAAAPDTFSLAGADFGPDGGTARVTFIASAPIFAGGTSPMTMVDGQITSEGELVGVSPEALICGVDQVTADVFVTLPGGSCSPGPVPTIFVAPVLATIENTTTSLIGAPLYAGTPVFAAAVPEPFLITGDHFGPIGANAIVAFSEPGGGMLFVGGTAPQTFIEGVITSRTTILGTSPVASVCGAADALVDVQVLVPGGSCVPTPIPATFVAPTVVSVTNTSADLAEVPAAGPGFYGTLPTDFSLVGTDFGPVGGVALVRFTSMDGDLIFSPPGSIVSPLVDTIDVLGTIVSRTEITGTTPAALLCEALDTADPAEQTFSELASAQVLLEAGMDQLGDDPLVAGFGPCSEVVDDATTFYGPNLGAMQVEIGDVLYPPVPSNDATIVLVPSTLPLGVDEAGTAMLFGAGFGPTGGLCQVTFTQILPAAPGIFPPAAATTLSVAGTVTDSYIIEIAEFPVIDWQRMTENATVAVTVQLFDSLSCVHDGEMFTYVAPPTIGIPPAATPAIQNLDAVNFVAGLVGTTAATAVADGYTDQQWPGCMPCDTLINATGLEATTVVHVFDTVAGLDTDGMPVRPLGTATPGHAPLGNQLGAPAALAQTNTVYAVTPGAPWGTIEGVTRLEADLAELDEADGTTDGFVTVTFRVLNVDGQFHDVAMSDNWRTHSALVNLSQDTLSSNSNVSVAIDPTSSPDDFASSVSSTGGDQATDGGNAFVVATNDALDFGYFAATDIFTSQTLDGGRTWTNGLIDATVDAFPISGFESRVYAKTAYDAFGNLYVVYVYTDPLDLTGDPLFGTDYLVVLTSVDAGTTFVVDPFFTSLATAAGFMQDPDIAAGPAGNGTDYQLGIVWADSRPTLTLGDPLIGTGGMLSTALGSWGGWFWDVVVGGVANTTPWFGAGTTTRLDAEIAIGPNGAWHLAWTEASLFTGDSVFITDVDRDGRWGGTYTWGPDNYLLGQPAMPANIAAQPDYFSFPQKDLAVVPLGTNAGRVVLAYEHMTPGSVFPAPLQQNYQVAVLTSDDYGANFIGPFVVHATAGGDQFGPALAADDVTGALYVTWYDSVLDTTANAAVHRMSSRSDDGWFWGDVVTLSSLTSTAAPLFEFTDYGLYQGLDVFGGCVLSGWASNEFGSSADYLDAIIRVYQQTSTRTP